MIDGKWGTLGGLGGGNQQGKWGGSCLLASALFPRMSLKPQNFLYNWPFRNALM